VGRQASRRLIRAAARSNSLSGSDGRDAAVSCARSYRKSMRRYSQMSPLEIWYARIDADDIIALAPNARIKAQARQRIAKGKEQNGSELDFPRLAEWSAATSAFMTARR